MEAEPSWAAQGLLATVCALTVIAVTFSFIGRLDVVVTASGHLQQFELTRTVQPLRISIVRRINVREGQRVRKGEILVALDHDAEDAEIHRAVAQMKRDQYDLLRLRALLAADDNGQEPHVEAPDDMFPTELSSFRNRVSDQYVQQKTKIDGLKSGLAEKFQEEIETAAQLHQATDAVAILSKEANIRRTSAQLGVGSRIDELEIEQRLSQQQDGIPQLIAHLREAVATRASLVAQLSSASADYRRALWDDMEKTLAEQGQARSDAEKAAAAIVAQSLRAPCDGTVQQLSVTTVGGVVTSAQPILSIVPESGSMIADLTVSNKDIGFLHVGQRAAVKVAAYPFGLYGVLYGDISTISRDMTTTSHDQAAESRPDGKPSKETVDGSPARDDEDSYVIQVRLGQSVLSANGKHLPLLPGMNVIADILTGRRRVIDYLLSPIESTVADSMRER